MKKKSILKICMALFLASIFVSCEKEPPESDFSATEISSIDGITVQFNDKSSNSPDKWLWTFEGGYPSSSTEENPIVTYYESGTFDVTLYTRNDDGDDETKLENYINVGQFYNPTWTDIDITVNNETKTIPIDGYVMYANIDNTSMSYYAETYGKTAGGLQVGLLIYWENNFDLTEYDSWSLVITSEFVFFYVTNNGYDDLNPFYVNYGTTEQSYDDIIIVNDQVEKSTGYYYAYYGMEVRAYLYSNQSSWVSWIENSHFYLVDESNLAYDLYWSPLKGSSSKTVFKSIKNLKAKPVQQTGSK